MSGTSIIAKIFVPLKCINNIQYAVATDFQNQIAYITWAGGPPPMENRKWLQVSLEVLIRTPSSSN